MEWTSILCAFHWQAALLHVVLSVAWFLAAGARVKAALREKAWWKARRCGLDDYQKDRRGIVDASGQDLLQKECSVQSFYKEHQREEVQESIRSSVEVDAQSLAPMLIPGKAEVPEEEQSIEQSASSPTRSRSLHPHKQGKGDGQCVAKNELWSSCDRKETMHDEGMQGLLPAIQSCDCCTNWPSVTIILPVHGTHSFSAYNFKAALLSSYPGRLSAIFVSDQAEDLGLSLAQTMARDRSLERVRIQLLVAGKASSCSQKLHNMICASEFADGELLFYLDDDVMVHPQTVERLVLCMCMTKAKYHHLAALDSSMQDETGNPTRRPYSRVVLATGYPIDMPVRGASLASYCKMGWHMPLLVGFSIKKFAPYVWGGCMMLWKDDLVSDNGRLHGLLQAWKDGGYSDDLIAAAWCSSNEYLVVHPAHAILPMHIEKHTSWRSVWNYIHRQMYVLDTYANKENRTINHAMLWWQSYLSAATIWPLVSSLAVCFSLLAANFMRLVKPVAAHRLHLTTCSVTEKTDVFYLDLELSSKALLLGALLSSVSLLCMLSAIHFQLKCMRWVSPVGISDMSCVDWGKVVCGFWACQAVVPLAAILAMTSPNVVWGETIYRKQRGKIVCMKNDKALARRSYVKKDTGLK